MRSRTPARHEKVTSREPDVASTFTYCSTVFPLINIIRSLYTAPPFQLSAVILLCSTGETQPEALNFSHHTMIGLVREHFPVPSPNLWKIVLTSIA